MSFGFRSVRSRYLFSGLAIALFPLLLVSLLSYFIAQKIITEQSEARLREAALRNAAELDGWFRKFGNVLNGTVEDVELTKSFDRDTLLRIVKGKKDIYGDDAFDFYVGFEDPKIAFVSATDWVPDASFDCRVRAWYMKARKTDGVIFTEPYLDAQTGNMILTAARRIMKGDRLVGVMGKDIFISKMIDTVREFRISEHSYAFLLDDKGNIVSHPDESFQPKKTGLTNIRDTVMKDCAPIAGSVGGKDMRILEIQDYDGRPAYFMLSRIPANGWTFGISILRADYRKPLRTLLTGFLIAFVLTILVGSVVMLRLVGDMVRPIRTLTGVIRNFSGRNLDVRVAVESQDEVGEMGRIFNGMADTIREYGRSLENRVRERTRELQEKNTRIQESIDYAKTLQESILPGKTELETVLKDYCAIWRPRDTVGGDFYWLRRFGDDFVLVVGDCTGHGVPGALMTMAAKAIFDRAVTDATYNDPAAVLAECNRLLHDTLRQEGGRHIEDGLDAGILLVSRGRSRARFAGAAIPLFVADGGRVEEIRGDKHGLGRFSFSKGIAFTLHETELHPGMSLYMATDGIRDQIGGGNGLPFGRSRLSELLASAQGYPMDEQRNIILRAIDEYRGDESVRDDMTLLGWRA